MNRYFVRFKEGGKAIEFGGGKYPLIRPNVDILEGPNVDIIADFNEPLPFADAEYDGIFCQYAIEHLGWRNVENFIKELYRILKPDGKAIIVTANTLEQCKRIANEGINKDTVEMLFGSQEFPDHGGVHKMGFSPDYAKKLFQDAGFSYVKTLPHPSTIENMVIEAYKIDKVFERSYFEDGTYGYKDYRDFATHYSTARIIMKSTPPVTSLLDLGGGRGYIARILENNGIESTCLDISKHCWHTRATDNFVLWDAMQVPWMNQIPNGGQQAIGDKEFDMCFSLNFLEHIPEDKLDNVIKESIRVSKRGLHGIHFTESPYEEQDEDVDITHKTIQSKSWWEEKFKSIDPNYGVVLEHPRILEYDIPQDQPPVSIMPRESPDGLVKLNYGSFLDMFYFGWMNIDILDLKVFSDKQAYDFKQHDINTGIPYEDNSVDIIMSNHLIEHLTRDEGKRFLAESYRALKPKGIIRISTPDTKFLTKQYVANKIMNYKYINLGVETADDDAEAYYNLLLSGHKTVYDEEGLMKLLEKIGFKNIKRCSPFTSRHNSIQTQTLTTHPSISIVLEAEK